MFVPTATRYTQTCIWLKVTRGKYESRSLDDDVYTLKKYEYLAGALTMRALADRAALRWVLQPQEQLKRTMRERSGGNEGR